MDILKFIEKFLSKHKSSEIDRLIPNLKKYSMGFRPLYTILDGFISWDCSKEGYYYYYFLQVRLLLGLTQALYEHGEFEMARNVLNEARRIMGYSDVYRTYHNNGTKKVDKHCYEKHKSYYCKLYDKLENFLNEKSC